MTKRVLVIADMCTVGQCSLSVALPILSACGAEACPLPVALLSSHSVGFEGYSRNTTVDMAENALKSLFASNTRFDAVFAMYLGGTREARLASAATSLLSEGGLKIVDPAMADFGAMYPDLDGTLAEETATLVAGANVVTPNLTEACLLAKTAYRERYDEAFVRGLAHTLTDELGAKKAVITGVSFEDGKIGAYAYDGKSSEYFAHRAEKRVCHGAGDVFSSALTGKLLAGSSFFDAVKTAEDFTYAAIVNTLDDPAHFYGLHFEKRLGMLTE